MTGPATCAALMALAVGMLLVAGAGCVLTSILGRAKLEPLRQGVAGLSVAAMYLAWGALCCAGAISLITWGG